MRGRRLLLYVDSNVFLSYFLGDFGKGNEFMEERVRQFLEVCHEKEHELLISNWMLMECEKRYITRDDILELLKKSDISFTELTYTKFDLEKAFAVNTHYADALHLVLARKAKADVIVTWNKKDFEGTNTTIMSPDEFF